MYLNGFKNQWDFIDVFGGKFGCFETGEFGYSDGKNFYIVPTNMTEEKGEMVIEESIKNNENIIVKEWEKRVFNNDVEY